MCGPCLNVTFAENRVSLYVRELSFLTLRPSIREGKDSLTIATGFLTRLFTLFLDIRTVRIIPSRRVVALQSRSAYFFSSLEMIRFSSVSHIDYAFGSFDTSWGWTLSGYARHDQVERFSISIVTKDDTKHFVCSFRGEGSVCTGWSGILLGGDALVDFSGTQEGESRKLAKYLAKLMGVTVGKPLKKIAKMTHCPECGRATSLYKPKCLYCGAQVYPSGKQKEGPLEEAPD